MGQPSRRAFLGATGLALTSAGCLGRDTGSDEPSTTQPTTETPTGTAARTPAATPAVTDLGTEQTVGGVPVEVSNPTVQDAVVYLDTPDSMAVAHRDGERYVLVSVSGSESGPPPTAFSLVVDSDSFGPADLRGGLDDYGPRYDPGYSGEEGYLPFVVPADVDTEAARVVVDHEGETAAWRLTDEHLDALGRPKARFELRTVELPETMRRGETQVARVAAENVSDVGGVFRGVLNVAGLGAAYVPYAFERDAEPGETVSWEKSFDEHPPDVVDSVGFSLYTVAGDSEEQATVAGDKMETTTESSATTANGTATSTTATTTATATTTTGTATTTAPPE
jgi:hypothetical protein